MVTGRQRGRRQPAGGYTLVALVVIVAVMNVLVAAALPMWSGVMQRERERELIFRGLQYAEAIRVFQMRFGRFPNTLDELIEVRPRSIRRLWTDPMNEEGGWGLIFAQAAQQPGQRGQAVVAPEAGGAPSQGRDGRDEGRIRTSGPIVGVHSRSDGQGKRSFLGGSSYKQWMFTVDLVPVAAVDPATLNVPRATSEWVGKPFREDLQPPQGLPPGQQQPGQPLPGSTRRQQPLG